MRELLSELASRLANPLSLEALRLAQDLTRPLEGRPLVEATWEGRAVFIGDLHGDLDSLISVYEKFADDKSSLLVFLGDYVDRGPNQLETLLGVLELKRRLGGRVVVLRGNHESPSMNATYGFYDELRQRLGAKWRVVYETLVKRAYARMPLALSLSLKGGKVFAVHGGPPVNASLSDIRRIRLEIEPRDDLFLQLLWNDPLNGVGGYLPGRRGVGYLFGLDYLRRFMSNGGFRMVVRGHEPVDGVRELFGGLLYTVFSCRHYGVTPAALVVNSDLTVEVVKL